MNTHEDPCGPERYAQRTIARKSRAQTCEWHDQCGANSRRQFECRARANERPPEDGDHYD
jgi:hypothetical protein